MSKEAFIIKGTKHGLSISISNEVDFDTVLSQLRAKLASAQQFFAGATIHVLTEDQELDSDQKRQLAETVAEFGMEVKESKLDQVEQVADKVERKEEQEATLLLRRTIRSGQRVWYDGNVVIMGDVNPGAEVICSGDILVLGALRGVAHAGCNGNVEASVFAFRLEPTQLRIASYISRSPDGKLPQPEGPEMARIFDNVVQISAY